MMTTRCDYCEVLDGDPGHYCLDLFRRCKKPYEWAGAGQDDKEAA